MPRIYTAENYAVDFCLKCFPNEETARSIYDYKEGAESWFVYGGEHHNYDDCDYVCEKCGCVLTNENGGK